MNQGGATRRKILKTTVAGGTLLSLEIILPDKWLAPVIESIVLPAHAAISGVQLNGPCSVEILSGNESTTSWVIRVVGFILPPISGVQVGIAALPNGGNEGKITTIVSTNSQGRYRTEIALDGGPGITGVSVASKVAGNNSITTCSAGTPPIDTPTPPEPEDPNQTPDPSLCPKIVNSSPSTVTAFAAESVARDRDNIEILFDGCAILRMVQTSSTTRSNDRILALDIDGDEPNSFDVETSSGGNWRLFDYSWGGDDTPSDLPSGQYQLRAQRLNGPTAGNIYTIRFTVAVGPAGPLLVEMTMSDLRATMI